MELVHGVVREPPAPRYGHPSVVTRLTALLDAHVRAHGLGQVCVSPVDVVLDEAAALVVQPDVVSVEVITFSDPHESSRVFAGDDALRSSVLPQWQATPALIFAP